MESFWQALSEINWLISLVGALLLSILANLLTAPVQNFVAKLSVERSRRRVSELRDQLVQIEEFVHSPSTLYLFVMSVVGRIILITLFAFAMSDMTYASISAIIAVSQKPWISEGFYSIVQIGSALLYLVGVNYTLKFLRVVERVRSYTDYKAEIEMTIASLEKLSPLGPQNAAGSKA